MTERDIKFIRISITKILSRECLQKTGKEPDKIQVGIIANTVQLIINDLIEQKIGFDCGKNNDSFTEILGEKHE